MNNRASLLECALHLFAERGYDAVGVQEICNAAGVTKPTLYHYFGSKRGLFEALLMERHAPFVAQLGYEAEYTGDLPKALERVTGACFRFAESEPTLARMVLALWFASPMSEATEVFTPYKNEQRRILEELFARAATDHGNMRGRQQTYAMTLQGMIHTYTRMAFEGQLRLDAPVVHRAVHQFSHGIYS